MKNFTKTSMGLLLLLPFFFSSVTTSAQSTCATAQTLVLDMTCVDETTAGPNSGDPTGNDDTDGNVCSSTYSGGDDFIFEYVGDGNALQLDLFATNTWTGLMVTEGCPTTGTCFASSTSSSADESLLTPATTMGVTYYIHISTYPSPQSPGQFCLNAQSTAPPMPPVNDECAGATAVTVEVGTCSSWTMGTNVLATTSSESFDGTCGGSTRGGDVWFTATVPAGGAIDLNRQSLSGISTLVTEVYTGSCGSLVYQDCADFSYPLSVSGLTPGDNVYFRFWDYSNNDQGTFEFCLGTPPPPPSNDACAGAINIVSGGVVTGDNSGATNVEGLSPCSGGTPGTDCASGVNDGTIDFGAGLWYVYNSTGTETVTIEVTGFDTELQVFTGSCGSFNCVAGDDDSYSGGCCGSQVCFESTASFAPVDYYIYVDGHGSNTGTFTLTLNAAPLPITLLSFEGEKMETANRLTWTTGSEANTEMHVIERSFDGNRWGEIGKIAAAGFSAAEQSYEFVDQEPLAKSFYRLKSVDFDGSFQLSNVVTIERPMNGFSLSRVFPVPVKEALNVEFNSDRNLDVNITVTDLMGRVMHTDVYNAADGTNNYQLDASGFANGVYFISLSNGIDQLTQRIVKN